MKWVYDGSAAFDEACDSDGELSIRCGRDVFDAPAGSFVFLPRGRPHRFWARDTSARLLLIVVPGGIEDYFGQINNASDEVEPRVRVTPRGVLPGSETKVRR